MDMAWIQVFVLTFAECVAPAGKTVCQEQQFELQFATKADCEYAMQQFVAMKDESENVIVNRQKTACSTTVIEVPTYESHEAAAAKLSSTAGWRAPDALEARRSMVTKDHAERLREIEDCDATKGAVPCKIGDIIVEEASGDRVDVWKRD